MGKLTERGQAFAEAGARLPAAMGPLGVITLVAATTGSIAVAGAVAAAFAGIVLAVSHDAAPVVVGLLAALAGFATPQIGPLVRVRRAVLLGDRGQNRTLPTAFSYEGAADKLS